MAIAAFGVPAAIQQNQTLVHTLPAGGSNRLVVVLAMGRDSTPDRFSTCTYDGDAMTIMCEKDHDAHDTKMYYMLDADLPVGDAAYNVVLGNPSLANKRLSAMAFTGVKQQVPEVTYEWEHENVRDHIATFTSAFNGSLYTGCHSIDDIEFDALYDPAKQTAITIGNLGAGHGGASWYAIIVASGAYDLGYSSLNPEKSSNCGGIFEEAAAVGEEKIMVGMLGANV